MGVKDNGAVDDYYSNLGSKDESNVSGWAKKKLKIKPKKKLIVKKVVKPETPKESVDASPVEPQAPEKTPETTPEPKQKKPEFTPPKRKSSFQVISKAYTPVNKSKSSSSSSSAWKSNQAEERKKTWTNDAPAWGSKKSDFSNDKSKKSKLSPYQWKRYRGKVHYRDESRDSGFVRSNKIKNQKKAPKSAADIVQNLVDRKWEKVMIPDVLTLKEFSEKIGIAMSSLIAEFMKNGLIVNINSKVDFDTASIIAEAFEIIVERDSETGITVDALLDGDIKDLLREDDTSKLQDRPPVISIMGHVDHGKTSLLDYIRNEKVADGEAGWITQSIGAYQAESNGQKITFIDTPWHEAFTIMRSRWAKSTDIAILVVAADEWVKPQTIESISHAKEAGIPVIVAVNKMDKEWANPDHVKGQLSEHGLVPEDWGGDTPVVPVSAKTGFGIDELLEIILLVSEMQTLKANPNRPWVATVIESHLDSKLGPVATVLVNTGTIEKWDNIVCKDSYGKVKVLKNFASIWVKKAIPGDPVLIVWLDNVVWGWDILQVVASNEVAREKSIEYKEALAHQKVLDASGIDVLMSKIKAGNLQKLKIVLKADTNWSLEAIRNSVLKLSTEDTIVSVIHSWVGNVTEGDILMCNGSEAILIWFGVSVVPTAKRLLEETKIEYIDSKIIYHITEKIEAIITGMYNPKEIEVPLCDAKVGGIFFTSKKFSIIWLIIKWEDARIENGAKIRVTRGDDLVGHWEILSLKQWVEEVKAIDWPTECGIKFKWDIIPEMDDKLEIYKTELEKRK